MTVQFIDQDSSYGMRWNPSPRCTIFGHGERLHSVIFDPQLQKNGHRLYELIIERNSLAVSGRCNYDIPQMLFCDDGVLVIFNEQGIPV